MKFSYKSYISTGKGNNYAPSYICISKGDNYAPSYICIGKGSNYAPCYRGTTQTRGN
jgi:hypothetical protein